MQKATIMPHSVSPAYSRNRVPKVGSFGCHLAEVLFRADLRCRDNGKSHCEFYSMDNYGARRMEQEKGRPMPALRQWTATPHLICTSPYLDAPVLTTGLH